MIFSGFPGIAFQLTRLFGTITPNRTPSDPGPLAVSPQLSPVAPRKPCNLSLDTKRIDRDPLRAAEDGELIRAAPGRLTLATDSGDLQCGAGAAVCESHEEDPMLAYDYPLLGVFWSLFMFALFVLWIFIVIWAFIDNFRRTDHHGVAKALWFLFIVFVPIIGVLAYLITRPADPYAVIETV